MLPFTRTLRKCAASEACKQLSYPSFLAPSAPLPRLFPGRQCTNALSRLARAVFAGFKVGASLPLLACSDPVDMGVELGQIKGPSAVPDKIYKSSADLLHRKQGDMAGSWLVHAVPGLEARGLCPPAPPLRRLACTCCSRARGWGAVPPCTPPLMLA